MDPRARPAARLARLLAAAALSGAAPLAHGNVTGSLDLQSHTTRSSSAGVSASPSTLLLQSFSAHYGGLPLGPDVAILTAGGSVQNATSWLGNGGRSDGQVYTYDGSLGLLPRRAVPLRLYGSGSVAAGSGGNLAGHLGGPSWRYGATLNLEPGVLLSALPGLRLDASEARSSRPGQPDGSDVLRRLTAHGYGTVARQRVNLAVQLDDDHRHQAGDISSLVATLNVGSDRQQTTVLASDVRRSLPSLAGITSDRLVSATGDQRWSPRLATQEALRLGDVGAPGGASGTLGDLRGSATWIPIRSGHQLTLTGSGSAGFARTEGPSAAGRVRAGSDSRGYGGRIGYTRPIRSLTGGVSLGSSVNTVAAAPCRSDSGAPPTAAECGLGNEGTETQLDGSLTLALKTLGRVQAQGDYTLVRVFAPLARGGDRTEHHARAFGRLQLQGARSVNASLAYDDAIRELIDLGSQQAIHLQDRSLTATVGGDARVSAFTLAAEVRETVGSVVTNGSPFTSGGAGTGGSTFVSSARKQVRSITAGQASATYTPRNDLALQAQGIASYASLESSPAIVSYGSNLGLVWRVGRFSLTGQYQLYRVRIGDAPASVQHSFRTALSRPFDL